VGHPTGALKEQSANFYAQKMADRGYVTVSLDLPFGAGARASHATPSRRTSTPGRSAPRWTSSARSRRWTVSASASW
jgi:hypothetical protein